MCVTALVTACYTDPGAPASEPSAAPTNKAPETRTTNLASTVPSGAAQAAILQDPPASDGSVTFTVRVAAKDVGLSAYQGNVTFTPGTLQLQSFSVPSGAGSEVYVVNQADFASGHIRFAACSATTFAGATEGDGVVAFRFTVRSSSNLAAANIAASLSVVGTESGTGLAPENVLGSAGVLAAPQR
jgi:hypothetical protein